MINLFIASGNLGGDIEVRFTPNQKCIGTFSLPVKSGWGDNEKTTWVRCKVLGDRAEKLQPYLTKGSLVTVTGEFYLDEYTSNDKEYKVPTVVVKDIQLPAKTDNTKIVPPRQQAEPQKAPPQKSNDVKFDDDIPF